MAVIRQLLLIPLLLLGVWATPVAAADEAAEPDTVATSPTAVEDDVDNAAEDAELAAKKEEATGLTKLFQDGGKIMYILAFLAILSLGIIMERIVNLNRSKVAPAGFEEEADRLWQAGDHKGLRELCEQNGSTLANAVEFCVDHREDEFASINEGAGEIASRDMRKHLQTNYWLAVVATLSPLLGLLGTIIGMIDSFAAVAVAGEIGDIGSVAGGISKALVTTATGLVVAIPSLAAFHFFKGRVTQMAILLEDASSGLIRKWFKGETKTAA